MMLTPNRRKIRDINYNIAQRIRIALFLLENAIYKDDQEEVHRQLVEINHATYCIESNSHCQEGGDEAAPS